MSNYLITGGAGFIGSNFCKFMIEKYPQDNFIIYDLLTYKECRENIKFIKKYDNCKFIYGDICNKKYLFKIFQKEKIEYVVNFAAETNVDKSILNPEVFFKTNILGTHNLLEASKKFGVKRFHQVSTDEVYGELQLDSKEVFYENSPLLPTNSYSISKASADLLVLSYFRTYGLDVTISRSTNNYGPNQFDEKFFPKMIKKFLNNEDLPIYGNGLNKRNWIYVYDHCNAIDIILQKGKPGEVYNVGSQNEFNNIEIIEKLKNFFKESTSKIRFVNDRIGHDLKYAVNYTKLMQLGWNASYSFEKGISETISWYKAYFQKTEFN